MKLNLRFWKMITILSISDLCEQFETLETEFLGAQFSASQARHWKAAVVRAGEYSWQFGPQGSIFRIDSVITMHKPYLSSLI